MDSAPECSVTATFRAFGTLEVILPVPESQTVWCGDVTMIVIRDASTGKQQAKISLQMEGSDTIISLVRAGPGSIWAVTAHGMIFVIDCMALVTQRVVRTHVKLSYAVGDGETFVCLISRSEVLVFTADSAVSHHTITLPGGEIVRNAEMDPSGVLYVVCESSKLFAYDVVSGSVLAEGTSCSMPTCVTVQGPFLWVGGGENLCSPARDFGIAQRA